MIRSRRCVPLSILAAAFIFSAAAAATETCAPEEGMSHDVVRVIDGETLLLDDAREVRLIGALPPSPDAASGNSQTVRALEELVGGRSVSFRYEGRRRDRYGRTLAQVHVAAQDGPVWLQQHLISQGYARAYALPGNSGCLRA